MLRQCNRQMVSELLRKITRNGIIQPAQEREELLMPVAGFALGKDGSGGDIQRCEKSGRPVADVIMGHSLHVPEAHRQNRLRTIQSLNLALFIEAKHQSVVGRVQIQTRDIAHFFDEERIVGQLKAPRCGWSAKARNSRCTVDLEIPVAAAAPRTVQ